MSVLNSRRERIRSNEGILKQGNIRDEEIYATKTGKKTERRQKKELKVHILCAFFCDIVAL